MRLKHGVSLGLIALVSGSGFDAKIARAQSKTPAGAAEFAKADSLAADPRLARKITFICSKAKISDVLEELRTYTPVRFVAKKNWQGITLRVRSVSLADALDSIGANYNAQWKREGDKWVLSTPGYDAEHLDSYHPHTDAEAEMFAKGHELIDAMKQLPPETQQALTDEAQGTHGIPLEQLPEAMQNMARAMYAAQRQIDAPNPMQDTAHWPDALRGCKVRLVPYTWLSGISGAELILHMDHPNESFIALEVGSRFNVLPGPKPDYHIVPYDLLKKEDMAKMAAPYAELKKSREDAQTQDSRLNEPVTLTMEKVTFATAIQRLADAAGISYVATVISLDNNLRTFHFNNTPLRAALDEVTGAYRIKIGIGGRMLPGDAPDELKLDTPQAGFAQLVTTEYSKTGAMKPPPPIIYAWGWRKSGIFQFTGLSEGSLDDYNKIQAAEKPKSADASKAPAARNKRQQNNSPPKLSFGGALFCPRFPGHAAARFHGTIKIEAIQTGAKKIPFEEGIITPPRRK